MILWITVFTRETKCLCTHKRGSWELVLVLRPSPISWANTRSQTSSACRALRRGSTKRRTKCCAAFSPPVAMYDPRDTAAACSNQKNLIRCSTMSLGARGDKTSWTCDPSLERTLPHRVRPLVRQILSLFTLMSMKFLYSIFMIVITATALPGQPNNGVNTICTPATAPEGV